MSVDFEDFTAAIERQHRLRIELDQPPQYTNVTVLGGGPDGRQIAALALAENLNVTLFSAYGAELDSLQSAGGITVRGDGPIGTYQTQQVSQPSIQITAKLDHAVHAADLIFLTGPLHKHRTYAMVLADHLSDGQTIVIAPARTFGAIESSWMLKVGGCTADIAIVEVQNLPYWNQTQGGVLNLSAVRKTAAAVLSSDKSSHVDALKPLFGNIHAVQNVLHSSFADASGAVEAVALLVNDSLLRTQEKPLLPGAEPLTERNTFRSLVAGERSQDLIFQMLEERRSIARRLGVRNLPDNQSWLDVSAGTIMGSGSRPIPGPKDAVSLLTSAVTGSLVPLQSAGVLTGAATPTTDAMITLAGALLQRDLHTAGRRLENMGIHGNNVDQVRRRLESAVRGG